ncbi:hypothetical protein [Streptomyces sp. NPDC048473]
MLDQLLRHCEVVSINGNSYRFKVDIRAHRCRARYCLARLRIPSSR